MLERRYEVTMAKPTASDSGTKSAWAAPCMKNDGIKTASTQSIASSRGIAVCWLPRRTAGDRGCALHLVVDVLNLDGGFIDQDADGQRQAAQGHQVDRLPGEPHRHQRAAKCEGDVEDDDDDAPPVAEEEQHHQPGQDGAQAPSVTRLRTALVTVGDWSNSKLTLMSSGRTACMLGRAFLTLLTTESVEASARLVTRM